MKRLAISAFALVALAALAGSLYLWHHSYLNRDNPFFGTLIGGIGLSYNPQSHDRRLELIAEKMRPIITQIESARDTAGHYPVQFQLPNDGTIQLQKNWIIIFYDPEDEKSSGFRLGARLGWDPSLIYNHTTTKKGWSFDPGDGSPEIPVDL